MRIRISGRLIYNFRRLSSGSVNGWGGWRAGRTWSRLWSAHSVSGRGSCTSAFASPPCLQTLCSAILARKPAGGLVMMKHCRVSLHCSLHLIMPKKLNTPLLLFSDLGVCGLNEIFRFLNCGARRAFFGHFGHIQCHAHVRLFQLYPTSLPCHSCRNVGNL